MRLVPHLVDEDWWENDSLPETLARIPKASINRVIAHHSLQFGSPTTICNVVDYIAELLRPGGEAWFINIPPYLHYVAEVPRDLHGQPAPEGTLLPEVEAANRRYANGENVPPGGAPPYKIVEPYVPFVFSRFTYFDEWFLPGVLTRAGSGSDVAANYAFSPHLIWTTNKLTPDDAGPQHREREIHVGVLRKRDDDPTGHRETGPRAHATR